MRHAMRKPIYKHRSTGRVKEIKQYLNEHDLIFRTGFLATVESHCNVSFEILKVYSGTFQNTVDIGKRNELTHVIMQHKLLHVAL